MKKFLAVFLVSFLSLPVMAQFYRGSSLRIVSPSAGTYSVNSILKIEWTAYTYPESLTIYLKRNGQTIMRLGTLENLSLTNNRLSSKATNYYYWRILENVPSGSGYYIEIVTGTGKRAVSPPFTIKGSYPGSISPGQIQPVASNYIVQSPKKISIQFDLKTRNGSIYFMGNRFAYLRVKTAIPGREYILDSSGSDNLHVDLLSRRAFFRYGGTLHWADFNLYRRGKEITLEIKGNPPIQIQLNPSKFNGMVYFRGKPFIKLTVTKTRQGVYRLSAGGRALYLDPFSKILEFRDGNIGVWATITPAPSTRRRQ